MRGKLVGLVAAAIAATTVVGGVASPAFATASPASASAVSNNLRIVQGPTGQISVLQGSTLQAGQVVKAQISSTYTTVDANGNVVSAADPEIFQLLNGGTLPQMDVEIAAANQGGQVAAAAMDWFLGHTTFHGGLSATGSDQFDLIMPPGRYNVAQLRPVGNVKPSTTAVPINVVGSPNAIQPYADQKLTMTNVNEVGRFSVSGFSTTSLHRGMVTVVNRMDELGFAQFTQVQPTTTDQQVANWVAGTGPSPALPGGSTLNFGTLSPAQLVNLNLNVAPGRYMILNWIPDRDTGIPQAVAGMHAVVDVTS